LGVPLRRLMRFPTFREVIVSLSSRVLRLFATAHKGNPIIRNVFIQPTPNKGLNYRRPKISQFKCLRAIGNFPRRTPIPHLHTTLNVTPIRDFIYHLTANFLDRCPAHPNLLARSIGNYSLVDHHQYKKYIHKRPKHILF
jgi:hypothetical protein